VEWNPVSSRLLQARLLHRHGHLKIIVVYAPTEVAPDNIKDEFYNQLESLILSTSPHDQLLFLGDFNATSGTIPAGFENVLGNYGSGTSNDNSARFLSMCSLGNLSITGSFFRRRVIHRFSWISNDHRTKKEIDHILSRDRSVGVIG
jgi:hypothetical protein